MTEVLEKYVVDPNCPCCRVTATTPKQGTPSAWANGGFVLALWLVHKAGSLDALLAMLCPHCLDRHRHTCREDDAS